MRALFARTPTVTARDGRGLEVCTLSYHRHPDTPEVTDTRRSVQHYDLAGRAAKLFDPRLSETPCVHHIHTLSGSIALTESVDAGVSISLMDAAGRPSSLYTGVGSDSQVTREWDYEPASLRGRVLSIREGLAEQPARVSERFVWAQQLPEEKRHNLCGQCIRHYDPAGLDQTDSVALCGQLRSTTRRLATPKDNVDWQGANEDDWRALLEPDTFTTRTLHDSTGSPLAIIDAMGHLQRMAYDVAGQLKCGWITLAGADEQPVISNVTYGAWGEKRSEHLANGVSTEHGYEPETLRLIRLKSRQGTHTLQDLNYEYDPMGNVLHIRDLAQAERYWRNQKISAHSTFAYDTLYQMTRSTGREMANNATNPWLATLPPPVTDDSLTRYDRSYRYDRGGNLTRIRHNAPAANHSFMLDMTVSPYSNRAVIADLTDDPEQVDTLFSPQGQQRYLLPGQVLHWNTRGELSQVTPVTRPGNDSDIESYQYAADARRIRKIRRSHTRNAVVQSTVVYLPGLEIRTTTIADERKECLHIVTLGQVRVMHWQSGLPEGIGNDQVRYSLTNLVGSHELELDDRGALISREEFYPYGGRALWSTPTPGAADLKIARYSGKERDATGLYYYGHRYYQPWAGRWLSSDPAGTVDGPNLYRMARNNPASLIDSDGRIAKPACLGSANEARFDELIDAEAARLPMRAIKKTIQMIWIGTELLSEKNSALSSDTARMNSDYATHIWFDSAITGHEAALEGMRQQFDSSAIRLQDIRSARWLSDARKHPSFDLYEQATANRKFAQASDLLRLMLLKYEGGVYKDIDDRQKQSFGALEFPGGLGVSIESRMVGRGELIGNSPIAAVEGHPVIQQMLEGAVARVEEGEEDIFRIAGPRAFTTALYHHYRGMAPADFNLKLDLFTAHKRSLVGKNANLSLENVAALQKPYRQIRGLGKFISNGVDHSWAR
ncbi:RHS repeat-associated core domain-containing protein [Pseudomonas wadenswilerensis]